MSASAESAESEKSAQGNDNKLKLVMRRVDAFQRSHHATALAYGVVKKYGDDNGGALAALLTYYGFLSVFPLLLVLVTVLGIVAPPNSSIEHHVLNSALAQFPVIGNQLSRNIKTLHRNSPVGLTIGLLGLLWGATGVCQNAQYAMAQVWNIPKIDRPGFAQRLGRSALLFAVGAIFVVVSSFLTGIATFSGKQPVPLRIGGALVSLIADIALFVFVFRVLTPKAIHWKNLVVGASTAGFLWAVLQTVGVYLMDHELKNMSQVYGFFAIVLGALWWIYLAAQILMYTAEVNVVRTRRLYPRSLVQPPLTPADVAALDSYALVERRRPEIVVTTRRVTDAPGASTHRAEAPEQTSGRAEQVDVTTSN